MRDYLKNIRAKMNMSQSDTANKLGISRQYYGFIENNDRQQDISLSLLQKISETFNVPLAELIESEKAFKESIKATGD